MASKRPVSRRDFAKLSASAGAAVGVTGLSGLSLDAQQGRGATPAPAGKPDTLKSEFLMDLELETSAAIRLGARGITPVTGGTFDGPKLKGTVIGPAADWTMRVNDRLTALDVRIILVTDDDQRIYMSYRGMIATTPADAATGQAAQRYWRVLPIFETESPKYDWLTRIMSVGVSYTVPQRVSYRVFQIL
jgi:hypothetical protein